MCLIGKCCTSELNSQPLDNNLCTLVKMFLLQKREIKLLAQSTAFSALMCNIQPPWSALVICLKASRSSSSISDMLVVS